MRVRVAVLAACVLAAAPRTACASEDPVVEGLSSTGFALMALQTASLIGASAAYSAYAYTSIPTTGPGTYDRMEALFHSTLSIGYASYAIGVPLLLGSYHRSRIVSGLPAGDAPSIVGWVFYGLSCVFVGVMPLFPPLAVIAAVFYATTVSMSISLGAVAMRDAREVAGAWKGLTPFARASRDVTMLGIAGRF